MLGQKSCPVPPHHHSSHPAPSPVLQPPQPPGSQHSCFPAALPAPRSPRPSLLPRPPLSHTPAPQATLSFLSSRLPRDPLLMVLP